MMRRAWPPIGAVLLVLAAAAVPAAEKAGKGAGQAGAAPKAAARSAAVSDEKVSADLRVFCKKWMGFLETRERDNRRAIQWQKNHTGVTGQFIGYSKEYDCAMKERSSNGTPVATIVYREFTYEQAGASSQEATAAAVRIVDAIRVTEIFRYSNGEWVY